MRRLQIIFIACFVLLLGGIGLKTRENHNDVSLTEGRKLQQFPELSYRKYLDAGYLEEISAAWDDQVAGREVMVQGYYRMTTQLLRQKYVGTTVIGKENQLFQEPEIIEDRKAYRSQVKKCARLINRQAAKIAQTGARFIYINYPRKDVVEAEYLPGWYPDSRRDYGEFVSLLRENLSEDVLFIDAAELFSGQAPDCYYKTDHHVNFQGQMLVYHRLMEIVGEDDPEVTVKSLSDYTLKDKVVDGSFNRKIGYSVDAGKEALNVKPNFSMPYQRNAKTRIFGGGDTYASAFMGGDYANTVVKRKDIEGPEILISGSSYTNSLEALCAASFQKMHSLDYRYNKSGKNLVQYVRRERPAYVVYIPNQSDRHFDYDTFRLHFGLE